MIGDNGEPLRVGFALGNEYADHVMERQNYLYLAAQAAPVLLRPGVVAGRVASQCIRRVRLLRKGQAIWKETWLSGEDNMAHSIANLEHHHFKYREFRRPGDVHVHLFGAATGSFTKNIKTEIGDVFEITSPVFGQPLRNPLAAAREAIAWSRCGRSSCAECAIACMADRLHVVFGGGPLRSRSCALCRRGAYRAVGDTRRQARGRQGDTSNGSEAMQSTDSVRRACAERRRYHCAGAPYDRWAELLPRMMDGIAGGARVAEATLVYGDNLYMYGRRRPDERGPGVQPEHAQGARCELSSPIVFWTPIIEARCGPPSGAVDLRAKRADVARGRASVRTGACQKTHRRVGRSRQAAHLHLHRRFRHSAWFSANARKLWEGLARAQRRDAHHRAFIERVCTLAGAEPKMRVVPHWLVSIMAIFNPMLREVKEMLYQFEEDFIVDSSRFTKAFGVAATPLDDAIRATLKWYRANAEATPAAR